MMVVDYDGWLVGCVEGSSMGVNFKGRVAGVLSWSYDWAVNGCELRSKHGYFLRNLRMDPIWVMWKDV